MLNLKMYKIYLLQCSLEVHNCYFQEHKEEKKAVKLEPFKKNSHPVKKKRIEETSQASFVQEAYKDQNIVENNYTLSPEPRPSVSSKETIKPKKEPKALSDFNEGNVYSTQINETYRPEFKASMFSPLW